MVEYPTGYEYPSGGFPKDLTWDEFLALPYELRNASLVDGEVVVNPPNAPHELVVRNLLLAFTNWLRAAPEPGSRGDVSTQQPVKINDARGYQPDFSWYPPEHCTPSDQPPGFSGLPGLVVEILSPSTRTMNLIRKRADYDQIGIDEAWFVDPGLQSYDVQVCRRPGADKPFVDFQATGSDVVTSPLLEGFEMKVSELFAR